jgi:hypothetical protein
MFDSERKEITVLASGERLPATTGANTVLIFGSRVSRAYELAAKFQAYLEEKNLPNPDVYAIGDAGLIEKTFLSLDELGKLNLPKGVILLPEMRQNDPFTGNGMSLDTYHCGIDKFVESLCNKYGVPLIKIKPDEPAERIIESLEGIYKLGE